MTIADTLVKSNNAFQRIFTFDGLEIRKGKRFSKVMEKLIDKEILKLKEIKEEIGLGEADGFNSSMGKGIEVGEKEEQSEKYIHSNDFHFEKQEIERVNEISKKLEALKKFSDSKHLDNKELIQELNEMHDFIAKLGNLAQNQAKIDYNLAHDHRALARFMHLRNMHSVANRLKVLEKKARKDRKREMSEYKDLNKEFDEAMKSNDIKSFNKAVSIIHKELNDFINDAMKEFTEMADANKMIALLVDHTIEYMGKLKVELIDAHKKGFGDEDGDAKQAEHYNSLLKRINYDIQSFHNLSEEFLSQDRSNAHDLGFRVS